MAANLEFLITEDFVEDLIESIKAAKAEIFIQQLTFDGDKSGLEIADELIEAVKRGVSVSILIDCFAKRTISDLPVSDISIKDEVAATHQMYDQMKDAGIDLKFTRPLGPLNIFAWTRNHKKLFVIDDACWLGGINISDHNFSWHDFNIKFIDQAIVEAVKDDFLTTRASKYVSTSNPIITNKAIEEVFDNLILNAKSSIVLSSPYALDIALKNLFSKATAKEKTLIINKRSNLRIYRLIEPYLMNKMSESGCTFKSYEKFSHAKFLLIDDTKLLIGSSNYGRHSFWCDEEICILIEDKDIIFKIREEFLDVSIPFGKINRSITVQLTGGILSHLMILSLRIIKSTIGKYGPRLTD